MIPSIQSILNFVTTNTFLLFVSVIDCYFIQDNSFIPLSLTTWMKNELLLYSVSHFVKKHPDIHSIQRIHPTEKYPLEFHFHVFYNSFLEVLHSYLIYHFYFPNQSTFSFHTFTDSILWFIPISFFFEIIFDLFHYWTHRIIHEYPSLYQALHRKHHSHFHPNVYTTFYQEPFDLLITNVFPTLMSFYILHHFTTISYPLWRIINTYKVYIEICGHSGKDIKKTCSFVQCIWIPKVLGIDLYTQDHDLHHSLVKCNYSKRFVLWDKIFGTYVRRNDESIENTEEKTE